MKLNFSMSGEAILGVYGRQSTPPTHIQFDFFKVLDGSRLGKRSKRAAVSRGCTSPNCALELLDKYADVMA